MKWALGCATAGGWEAGANRERKESKRVVNFFVITYCLFAESNQYEMQCYKKSCKGDIHTGRESAGLHEIFD
jgi:hypothetical protein